MSIHYGKNIKTRYFKGYINNFFTVGSPTFDGSVVSGFSDSNYLRINEAFAPKPTDTWEKVVKYTTNDVTSDQAIIGDSIDKQGMVLVITTSKLVTYISSGSSWDIASQVWGTYTLLPNTTYWFKVEFTGTAYNIYYSLNGVDYVLDITVASTKQISSSIIRLGRTAASNQYVKGSIDLSESYIKVNNELWWYPYKRCKYDYNFTTVGTPSISNKEGTCEVSGFSSANYLTVPENFDVSDGSTWEMVYKIRTGDDITTAQSICGHTGSGNGDPVALCVKSSKLQLSTAKGSSSSIFADVFGTAVLEANTDYFVKIVFDGSAYTVSYSTAGVDYIEDIRKESTTPIWASNLAIGRQQGDASEYPWLGSIDLTQSYIKINNQLWWTCFKQTNDYVFTREATKEDYDFTVFEDGKIAHFHRGDLYRIDYYKYTYEDWTQPVLTSNTSHGTVSSTNYNSSHPPYIAFDGVKANGTNKYLSQTTGTGDITWKTPEPIKINSCELYTTTEGGYLNRFPQTITVYGSDNGVDWVEIGSLSGYEQPASGGSVTVPCNAPKAYAYSKWEFTGSTYVGVSEIVISAQKQIGVVESTADDYDFTKPYKGEIILGYKGETLVYSIYPNGVVFEENTAGTYTITPAISGPYEISLVGPGSGGTCAGDSASYASKSRGAGGGSGAYVKGIWNLTRGVEYTIVVGAGGPAGPTNSNNGYSQAAGDSSFGDFLVCGGGGGATAVWKGSAIGGAAGTVKTCESTIQLITRTAGNQGSAGGGYTYYAGGVSVLPPYGAGGFGQATGNYAGKSSGGENGYCKVRMLTIEPEQQKINVNFVGNVNFNDGIVSNFTAANYLMLPEIFNPGDKSWEIVFKFNRTSESGVWESFLGHSGNDFSNGVHIFKGSSGKINLECCTTGASSWNICAITGTTVIELNKDYWVKAEFTGSSYNLYLSEDGIVYNLEASKESTTTIGATIVQSIGTSKSNTSSYFRGLINLNECYIKSNGEYVWKGISNDNI